MKKFKSITFVLAAAATFACSNPNKETTVSGVIYDATMNNLSIICNGDSLLFSTLDADKSQVNGILIGDTATVTYKGEMKKGEAKQAIKLAVKPAARVVDAIVGEWIQPIEGMDGVQGVEIKEDGTAASINMATLVYEKWQKDGENIIFSGKSIGNKQTLDFCDTMKIVKNDADSLVLVGNNAQTLRFGKQQ